MNEFLHQNNMSRGGTSSWCGWPLCMIALGQGHAQYIQDQPDQESA